jgi:hypothetical protein
MKARIKKTGEIVEVTRNTQGLYVDENRVGYTLQELNFGNEEDEHWQDFRERAAIVAMQGTMSILGSSDRTAFRDIVVEGFRGDKKTYPNEIAEFAVACADALIDELKKN